MFKNMLNGIWTTLREGTSNNTQIALAIVIIAAVGIFGCVLTFGFGYLSRGCSGSCIASSGRQFAGGFIAVLAAAGAFSLGGTLGLLFGSPRWTDVVPSKPDIAEGRKSEVDANPAPTGQSGGSLPPSGIRPNTSLERIADWLTTMIVGLGLVHLTTISTRLHTYGMWLTQAITLDERSVNSAPGVVISISFGFAGFLLVYLWALRFLPSELGGAYGLIRKAVLAEVGKHTEQIEKKAEQIEIKTDKNFQLIEEIKRRPIYIVSRFSLNQLDQELDRLGADRETRAEIGQRYVLAKTWSDDPMKDFGAFQAGGYTLSGRIEEVAPGLFDFHLALDSQIAGSAPVLWLLHNSYAPMFSVSQTDAGGAVEYVNRTTGAFWVGVVIPQPGKNSIRLALDLGTLPGATDEFRSE